MPWLAPVISATFPANRVGPVFAVVVGMGSVRILGAGRWRIAAAAAHRGNPQAGRPAQVIGRCTAGAAGAWASGVMVTGHDGLLRTEPGLDVGAAVLPGRCKPEANNSCGGLVA